ncbi:MAG: LysR substrate-binding domain-containing protein, partial [Pseudomonadota bacterium]
DELRAGSSSITVSVPPSFASKWLVPRLPYFLEQHADVNVQTLATEAVADLHTQAVDLAVRQGAQPSDRDLVARSLSPVELIVVCDPANATEADRHTDIRWFADQPLIQDSHRHWDALFSDVEPPHRPLSFNQTALAMDAAMRGQGYAVVPRLVAHADIASGRLVAVHALAPRSDEHFWLVHLNNRPHNQHARSLFVDWLIDEVSR